MRRPTPTRASELSPKVRIGIHSGYAERGALDFQGQALTRVARIVDMGHGGQILVSETLMRLAQGELPTGLQTLDLGQQKLKGLRLEERIFQITATGLRRDFPPLRGSHRSSQPPRPIGRLSEGQRRRKSFSPGWRAASSA